MTDYTAPWDSAFTVVGQTGQGASDRGFTEPATESSVSVSSAAQNAPPEAGEGQIWDTGEQEFGEPGITGSVMDSTPYEPPGVGPSVPWNAPPWVTEKVRDIDHGASAYFNSEIRPATGDMQARDQLTASWSRGITTDNLGNLDLTNISRPEHDMSFVVQRDNSPHWIGYEERPIYNNLASPGPTFTSANPGNTFGDGSYPNLSNRGFAAVQYVEPPDPAVITPDIGAGTEVEGDWE